VIRYLLDLWPLSIREGVEGRGASGGVSIGDADDPSERGLCPLHLALIIQDSGRTAYRLNLAKLLVEAWPEAVRERAPRTFLLPLNLALDSSRPCADVIHYMFEAYPDAIVGDEAFVVEQPLLRKLKQVSFQGAVSEHLQVVQFLVENVPNSLSERDHLGRLPLHYAAGHAVPFAITKCLVEQYSQALQEKDDSIEGGLTPVQFGVTYGTTVEHVELLVDARPESITAADGGDEGYTLLHGEVGRRDIQWDVLRYLVETSPQSLRCRSAKRGLLPLHVAASSPSLSRAGEDPV
jgi:hypothetical protein